MEVDHLAIAVLDITTSLPFYVERLGLSLLHEEELPSAGVRLAYLDGGTTMIQLVQPIAPCPVADFLTEQGEGLHHVCFTVDNIATTLGRMPHEAGTRVTAGGRDRRACFLAARPNGIRIELTERTRVPGSSDRIDDWHRGLP